jgi:hypothetical protein
VDQAPTTAGTPAIDAADASPDLPGTPAPCDRCGREADADFGALWLCLDCYHVAGSTCAGIGVGPTPVDPVC